MLCDQRDRKRANGKVEGRKSHLEARPEVVAEAKRLHRASPKTGERRSLRKIAAELAALGHLNVNGQPYDLPHGDPEFIVAIGQAIPALFDWMNMLSACPA